MISLIVHVCGLLVFALLFSSPDAELEERRFWIAKCMLCWTDFLRFAESCRWRMSSRHGNWCLNRSDEQHLPPCHPFPFALAAPG